MTEVAARPLVAAIEAGGTKFVCGSGRSRGDLMARGLTMLATTDPERTVGALAGWAASLEEEVAAVGVASFGPLDLAGRAIASTPKPGWSGFDWAAAVGEVWPGRPMALETDVGAAALAESRWGAAEGRDPAVYVTVGTGIGGGVVAGGAVVHGLVHPEIGHMRVGRRAGDDFAGSCPFHGDCLEGLAGGPAVERRWGERGEQLPPDHAAWDLEAWYLGRLVANLVMALSPQVVVLGGGVMGVPGLLDRVRAEVPAAVAGYLESELLGERISDYVVPPGLGTGSGIVGALAVGQTAAGESR